MPMTKYKSLSSLKEKIDNLHDVLNFSIPENKVVTYKDTNGNNFENIKRDNHAAIYIGKMFHGDEWIYNNDTMAGMLHYAAQRLHSPDEKINLQVAGDVYDIFAGEETDGLHPMSAEEQHNALRQIIEEDKTLRNRINIVNLSSKHDELINTVKNHGMKGLLSGNNESLFEQENPSSKDIAAYLYQLCLDQPAVKNLFMATVPEKLKDNMENRFYYALIEVAIRMYDLLHGITLQWGVDRQSVYDQLIMFFSGQSTENIPAKLKDISAIVKLQKRSTQQIGENKLKRWYFKNKQFLSLLPRLEKKEQIESKISKRKAVGATAALAIILTFGGHQMNTVIQKNKKKAEVEYSFNKLLENKHISTIMEWKSDNISDLDEQKKFLRNNIQRQVETFISRYGLWDLEKEDIELLMLNTLLEYNKRLSFVMDATSRQEEDFIRDIFIPRMHLYLEAKGIELVAYKDLEKYENIIERSLDLPATVDSYKDVKDDIKIIKTLSPATETQYGNKIPASNLGITTINNKEYLATGSYDYYTLAGGQSFALKYFRTKYPILNDILRDFYNRYINPYDETRKARFNHVVEQEIKPFIIKTCIKENLLQNLEDIPTTKIHEAINRMLDEQLVPKHRQEIAAFEADTTPYENLKKYKEAIENIISYKWEELYGASWKELANRNEKRIGRYKDNEWETYRLSIVTLHGKKYMVAAVSNEKESGEGSAFHGKRIARELITLWEQQKKEQK